MHVGLFSGGLDSELTREWCRRNGLDVRWLHFDTGFVKTEDIDRARRHPDVEVVDVRERYLREVVTAPRHGYGGAMNPCLDCRIFLLKRAAEIAGDGPGVVVTGEVLGQRGFDQSRHALTLCEEEAGVAGRVFRPLCGALLEEVSGVGGRTSESLHGRSRREQLRLARRWGLRDLPIPSGGCCRLARAPFARRLRDLLDHGDLESVSVGAIERLRLGRHFRMNWRLKIVVARNRAECDALKSTVADEWMALPMSGPGATAVIDGNPGTGDLELAAAVTARYSSGPPGALRSIRLTRGDRILDFSAAPLDEAVLERRRV